MKRHVFHYTAEELTPFIDWSYLLHAWGVNGTLHAETAQELISDAREILLAAGDKCCAHALFALCDATGNDDDIIIEGTRLPLLRQQHCVEGKPNMCLSDFLSPYGDKIGLFATTVDGTFGNEYRADDYKRIIANVLADRLAEAAATLMHRTVRTGKEFWGYSPCEHLTVEELNREEYQGIRPAVGYPSLPDQSIIFIIDKLLQLADIGIRLTSNGAMFPHSSVCGLMFSHPAARYFGVGNISREQLHDYAKRRGLPANDIARFLTKNTQESR